MSRPTAGGLARTALVGIVACTILVGTAAGPQRIAAALMQERAPGDAANSPGFEPAEFPLQLTARKLTFFGVDQFTTQPIRLRDGSMSPPNTVYARVHKVELENMTVTSDRGGRVFEIVDKGTSVISNDGAVGELWLTVAKADFCVSPENLRTLVTTYAGVLGGRLDTVLRTIGDVLAPYAHSPLGPSGPCLPVEAFLTLAATLAGNGLPLPDVVPAANAEAALWAVQVRGPHQDGFVFADSTIRVTDK